MKPENEAALLEVVKAARVMLANWDEAIPHINSAIQIATIHSFFYRGPQVLTEPLRDAIANLDRLNP